MEIIRGNSMTNQTLLLIIGITLIVMIIGAYIRFYVLKKKN